MSAHDRKRKLLKAAERAPLDPKDGRNASTLRRLAAQGYLRREARPWGAEVFVRTDKPYGPRDSGFDFAAHRRRFEEW